MKRAGKRNFSINEDLEAIYEQMMGAPSPMGAPMSPPMGSGNIPPRPSIGGPQGGQDPLSQSPEDPMSQGGESSPILNGLDEFVGTVFEGENDPWADDPEEHDEAVKFFGKLRNWLKNASSGGAKKHGDDPYDQYLSDGGGEDPLGGGGDPLADPGLSAPSAGAPSAPAPGPMGPMAGGAPRPMGGPTGPQPRPMRPGRPTPY